MDDYSNLSDEELQRIVDSNGEYDPLAADGGSAASAPPDATPDFSQMSDDDLKRIVDSDGEWMPEQTAPQQPQFPSGDDYGFTDRQRDQIAAEGGRKAYTGQEYVEGLAPLTRAMRQGRERDEDKELGAWLSDGDDNTLRVALGKHGAARDPSLEGYKAKETGGFWEGVGDDLSRNLAQLPLGAGWLFRKAREADNPQKYATDHLMQSAFLSGFSRADIEQAKEVSQGDPAKMYDFFAERAEKKLKGFAAERQGAQERLAAHADEEGTLSKVAGGALGMIPMMEEFALGGAAGKAITGATKLGAVAKTLPNTWRGRVVGGLIHGLGTTTTMAPEMARRRYGELTADEYSQDENGNLVKREGDTAERALPKAILGGVGEAAIFSMPIGEAAFGWTTPMVTKALRTKVGNTVANMYTNYVKYGQMTGLRGQPQMLALMDLNAFKDEVMGLGKKDADYEGFDKEWDRFVNGEDLPDGTHRPGTLSLEGQADMFIGTLGVMLAQGSVAGAKAWRHGRAQKTSYDRLLRGAFKVPQDVLDKMEPDLKRMLVRVGDNLYSGKDAFGRSDVRAEQRGGKNAKGDRYGTIRNEAGEVVHDGSFRDRLERWCEKVGAKLGKAQGEAYEQAGKYALEFDNTYNWEKDAYPGQYASRFQVPTKSVRDKDGKLSGYDVAWEDVDVPIGGDKTIHGQQFTDPNTGISVLKYMQTDRNGGNIYLITDENGHRATRFGQADAMDAAKAMDAVNQRNIDMRGKKVEVFSSLRDQYKLNGEDFVLAKDGAEFDKYMSEATGGPYTSDPGESAVTLPDGRTLYCLDRMRTPQEMKKNLLHEVGRHRGLDVYFEGDPNKIAGFVVGLARNGDPQVQNQLRVIAERMVAQGRIDKPGDIFKRDKNGVYQYADKIEEVYAHLFDREEVPDAPGWWDAHMNAVRRNLRKVFGGLSYSRAEAEEVYRGAMERLSEQTGGEIFYTPDEPPTPPTPPSGVHAERLQGEVDAGRAERRATDYAAAENALGEEIGAEHAALDEKRKARATTARRQQELAAQKAQAEAYDEQERQRIELERKEEQDAQDEAEIQRLIDAEERETDMAKREEYQLRRREITERRARERAEAKERADAEAEAAAQEREKQAQEREEQKRAGYESADEQARLDRRNAVKQAIREDDARRAEEYDHAEAERKAREAAEEAAPLPDITVVDAELQGKGRTAPQNDVVRVNYGAEDGREGHQIVARRVTDDDGKVIGWDVNAVANDGTETLIASTTKPKKDGEAAIRAVRRQIHEHFGLPYGRAQKEAMEAERRRVEESETRKETKDEARNGTDEEPAKPEQERRNELPPEGEEPRPADEGSAEAQGGEPIVVHHANEGREGDGVEAANGFLAGMFEDATTETPVEAPVAAPREEGAITPPRAAEGAQGGKSASGGDSSGFDFAAFDRINANRDPSTQFFDVNEELSPERRDENWRLVQGIAAMYDQKRIRGFYDFAKYMQRVNPAWYAEQKDGLRRLWNYAAETTGLFDRVGDYEARDAIRSVDEGRNVRDVTGINALQAALQNVDVEMYPAALLDSSDARLPNTKLAADPKTGIIPGQELKGFPRSLLSKPIIVVEFKDGKKVVGTGRHRKNLYERYGMDIPMRRLREADGWVTKKPDGSYDFTKIRILDALDNIQDSKGTIEDYVAFFGDVKIPRATAESEGFLGSKEARLAYALANDAHPDIRAAVNFEGGKVDGTVKPEQAAAIAEIAPIGAAPENDGLQHHLLKAALKDHTLDKRDLQIKASEALQMLRAKRNRDGMEQMGFEFLGDEDVQSAAESAEKYRAEKAAEYSRLAKSFREVQRAKEGDLVKKKITRDDLRALGINERKIAAGGKERQEELQRAIDKAILEKMRWESINLDPDLRAQMEKDLGIAPKEPDFALESVTADQLKAEQAAQAQREAIRKGLEAPLKGDGQVNVQPEMDLGQAGQQDLFSPIAETPAQSSAKVDFKRGDHVFLKGAAENQSVTFLKANADGTADVQVKTPGANRYMPNKVETRSVPLGDIFSTGMKDVLTEAERKRLAEGMASQRFFNAEEEVTPERNKDYADWLGKYRMADTPDHRREWARKNPDKVTPEALERAAFEARQYTPAKYKVSGAVKSRTLLEEPPALRATEPPDNDYKLHIPDSIIRNGDLQEHQAEFVGYAGKSHETVRPDGTRLGMMGGYGTGAGKSRMIAGIILDNRNQGRKRALWITTQSGLIDDVRSESKPFGMDGMVSDIFGGKEVSVPKDGIGFGTYHGLRQDGVAEKIAQQLGKDFDGVIAFDEIHRAKTEGGRTQDAVVKLQELLPKARVVYMSATGATDVGNLGYAQRLGLWGEGTAFKDFEDFKKKVEGKGVSAMEMVAQTLKRRGQYLSANLSKEGVEFDHVAVPTTDAQKRTYAEYNGALKDVYKGVYDALEALGRLDYTVPPSSLHGMQQRLHYSMVTALKLPVLIERAKQELAKGNVPVFSLVNTNEAGSTREVAKALEEGRRLGMDEVNFGPKQILLDFLTKEGDKTYNKVEGAYRDYQFPTMKPVKGPGGEVVGFERDPVADGIRRRLVREVEALPDDFGNPINMIIDAFGKDNVANLTGLNKGGMAEDYKAFQDGGKKVLVFSGVANTGYTFSSDRKYKNQSRRVLFPLQLGYRADELEQTLGRVHRNNQANAPIYIASTTDLPGERRFYSSVERRRGQMKALTTGDRAATGNGITSEGDNFETKYAQDAVDGIIAALHRMGKLDEIAREMNFIKRTQRADGSVVEVNGMLKRDKSGAILPNVPAKRFLNRLLMLDPKRQDAMFSAFKSLLDQNIRWAKDDGEYDIGLQDIGSTRNDAVRSVKLADDMEVGHVNSWFKTDKVPFDDFARDHAAEFLTYVRNKRTGETFAVRADGKMGRKQEPAAMRYAVDGTKKRMRASILDTEKPNSAYERLDTARAKELWDAEYGVIPDERADDGFYAHGDLLRHWTDVLGSKPPRTFRVKAGDAPEYIGAKIDADEIPAIFGRFGKAEEARDMVIDGKVREVLNNRTVDLVNGWTLKQVPRDGAKAVMVRGVEPGQLDAVAKELGGEVSKKRIFMKPDAAKLRKIIEEHPANLYRDDEKIGDTGNLRFFNEKEESTDEGRMRGKTYGVPYQGSKNRIADRLVAALPSGRRFVDLFSGGGAVTHAAMESGKYGTYRMNDLDGTGQDLFLEGVRGKWDGYSRKTMTPEEFAAIKGTPEALAWSFNGLGRNLARAEEGGRDRAAEQIRRVQSLSSLKDKAGKVVASKTDYRNVKLHKGDVVYADIPYEATDTRGYRKGMEFDKAAFVEWAQKQNVPVFVSEYTMPEGWTELRSFAVPGMRGGERAEKLFVQSKFADRPQNGNPRFFNRSTPDIRFFNIDEEAGRRVHAKGYDEALRMEGAGAGRREIWEKTGWWKGKDGKWRYEIPGISQADTQSMLDAVFTSGKFRDKNKANVYTFTLNDLEKELKDKGESLPTSVKTLLKAYPKLGKESIEVDRMAEQPKDGTLGYATKGTIHLYERGTTAETLNHELQHRIQAASGMAGGTNTDGKSFDRYTHEHGEWEARQAATRADMTAEQRDKTAPWETADRHGVAEDATQIDDANRARIRPDGEPPEPEPAAPAMDRKTGLFEKAKTQVVDRYEPVKQMVVATGKRDKKAIHNGGDPYDAMRLLHGHNEAARKRYEDIWKRPFEEMLRKSGVGLDDVGMYMLAMNAKDRNRKVLNRTGALDGAGMSDADADKALADLRSFFGADKMRKIEEMADFLWKMQDEGMDRRIESGRVSAEIAKQWRQEEPHHVPMRDDLSDEDGEYNRSTRQWRKSDFHEANGRYTLPDNPVEFMFKEYQDAMYGSNINDARRALADFVRSTPGVGKIRRGVRRGKAWSFTHRQIEDFPDPNYREQTVKGGPGRPNLVSFKEGGDLYMIELNGKQGERVAEAVIGRGVVNMWKPVAAFTRAYASTATELSPAFLGRNFVADMIEASLNTMADKGLIKGGFSAAKNVVNALRMTRTIRRYITTGRFEGEFADTMRRYVESGASIGGMGNEGYTELKNDLGKVASGKHGVADVLKFVGRGISNFNKQAELATRLAVFKDYIDGGASDGEAAMRSREYSTDFNKYGNQRWMNSAWMFSGSVIGGAVRQTASLVQGKSGKQLMLGLFAYGLLEGMMEHFYNADDDEKARKSGQPSGETMTEYNRANSLYFRMGDRFIRAPFHAGPFSVLKYAGNLAARAALGDISGAEAAKHIAKEAFDSGMHFTGTGDFNSDTPMQSLLPTLLVPFYQLKGNEDYAGRPIRRQMFSETKPYSENGRKQTGDIWKSMARGMNELTGGNERRRGWFDFSPENYKFVVDSALKNLGRDITTVSDFVTDLCEGKDVDKTHILFGRDYVRSVPDNTQNFYEAEKAYNADRADGTIKPGSRRDEAVKKLLRDITTLRHWEDGEEKVGSRWVKRRNPSEATKEKHKKMRLRYQQRVIEIMRRKK